MVTPKQWGRGTRFHDFEKAKDILLRLAIECFARKGVKATTMQDLADAAQVSRRTVYRYFPDKRELLCEAFSYSHALACETVRAHTSAHESDFFAYLEDCVVAAVRFYVHMDTTLGLDSLRSMEDTAQALHDHKARQMWTDLLREPYLGYAARCHPREIEREVERDLNRFAELAHLLVAGHRQLRSSESTVRQGFRDLARMYRGTARGIRHQR